jgi:hypothetical protein
MDKKVFLSDKDEYQDGFVSNLSDNYLEEKIIMVMILLLKLMQMAIIQ